MTQTRNCRASLSKLKMTAFEQCPKTLWLATHGPEFAEQDESADAQFAIANAVARCGSRGQRSCAQ